MLQKSQKAIFRRRRSTGLGGSQDLQLSDWIHWGGRSLVFQSILLLICYLSSPTKRFLIIRTVETSWWSLDVSARRRSITRCFSCFCCCWCFQPDDSKKRCVFVCWFFQPDDNEIHVFVVVDVFNLASMWFRWTGWRTTRWQRACSKWRTTFSLGTQPSVPLSSRHQIEQTKKLQDRWFVFLVS